MNSHFSFSPFYIPKFSKKYLIAAFIAKCFSKPILLRTRPRSLNNKIKLKCIVTWKASSVLFLQIRRRRGIRKNNVRIFLREVPCEKTLRGIRILRLRKSYYTTEILTNYFIFLKKITFRNWHFSFLPPRYRNEASECVYSQCLSIGKTRNLIGFWLLGGLKALRNTELALY